MSTTNPFVASAGDRWFTPPSGWWRALLQAIDRGVLLCFDRDARTAICLMDRLGRLAHGAAVVAPARGDVATLFHDRDPAEWRQIARASAALRFKNRAAIAVFQQRGIRTLAQLAVTAPGEMPASLRHPARGAIVLTFHVGAQFGISATLQRWGLRTLALRDLPIENAYERARTLHRAIEALRTGVTIVAAVDGPGGASTAPVTCLGRRIVLRRGPFMLARVLRVPLIPAVARWTPGGEIDTVFGEPLEVTGGGTADDVESRLAEAAAAWIEQHVNAHPGEIWPYTLANLLAAPSA